MLPQPRSILQYGSDEFAEPAVSSAPQVIQHGREPPDGTDGSTLQVLHCHAASTQRATWPHNRLEMRTCRIRIQTSGRSCYELLVAVCDRAMTLDEFMTPYRAGSISMPALRCMCGVERHAISTAACSRTCRIAMCALRCARTRDSPVWRAQTESIDAEDEGGAGSPGRAPRTPGAPPRAITTSRVGECAAPPLPVTTRCRLDVFGRQPSVYADAYTLVHYVQSSRSHSHVEWPDAASTSC